MIKSLQSTDQNSMIVPSWTFFYLVGTFLDCPNHVREGVKKNVFLGLCPKLWVDGGPKS